MRYRAALASAPRLSLTGPVSGERLGWLSSVATRPANATVTPADTHSSRGSLTVRADAYIR